MGVGASGAMMMIMMMVGMNDTCTTLDRKSMVHVELPCGHFFLMVHEQAAQRKRPRAPLQARESQGLMFYCRRDWLME